MWTKETKASPEGADSPQEAIEKEQEIQEEPESISESQGVDAEGNKPEISFDDALKKYGYQPEFDRRVQKAVKAAVIDASKGWESEAAEEKAEEPEAVKLEHEISRLKKQLAISENTEEAHGIGGEGRCRVPYELMDYAVCADKEVTVKNATALVQAFGNAVQEAIKKELSGNVPKGGRSSGPLWTKEQIMAVKDRKERWRLIAENPQLFTRRGVGRYGQA